MMKATLYSIECFFWLFVCLTFCAGAVVNELIFRRFDWPNNLFGSTYSNYVFYSKLVGL